MKRILSLCLVLVLGIFLGACSARQGSSEAATNVEASPTPHIVGDGVNLSLVGNTGRPQFIYAFAKW